jgi:hypothetical protein
MYACHCITKLCYRNYAKESKKKKMLNIKLMKGVMRNNQPVYVKCR